MTARGRNAFVRGDDMLALAEAAHRYLKRHYARRQTARANQRVRILLDYATRKQEEIESMISANRRNGPEHILDTHFQFVPDAAAELEGCRAWRPRPAECLDDVPDTVLEFDSLVQDCYQRAADMAPSEPVREMFACGKGKNA